MTNVLANCQFPEEAGNPLPYMLTAFLLRGFDQAETSDRQSKVPCQLWGIKCVFEEFKRDSELRSAG